VQDATDATDATDAPGEPGPADRRVGAPLPPPVFGTDAHAPELPDGDWYRALASNLPAVVVLAVDTDLRFVAATGAGLADFGWRAEDLLGRTPAEVLGAELAGELSVGYRAALAGEDRVLQRPWTGDSRRIWRTEFAPIRGRDGATLAAMAVSRDVTEQVRTARRLQVLFDQAPIGMGLVAPNRRFLQVNPALCALVGYSAAELIGKDFACVTHPDDRAADDELVARMLADEISCYERDKRYVHRDGRELWVHVTVSIVRGEEGSPRYFIGQIQDITERRRIEQALRDSEERYRRIVELADEGVLTVDTDARVSYLNVRMAEMLGYPVERVLGRRLHELFDGAADRLLDVPVDRRRDQRERYDVRFRRADGSLAWAQISATRIHAADGSPAGSLALVTDITARKHAETKLARLAWHDALTGLPNRAQLVERVGDALVRQAVRGGVVGLLFIDLDQFKTVNDSLGHAAGDQLLTHVADRLEATVRTGDVVARLGGDEFVVIADNLPGGAAAIDLAERVSAALSQPIRLAGLDLIVTASVGIALAEPSCPAAQRPSAEVLLHHADVAMYQAKARGRACWQVYDPAAADPTLDRLRMLGELRHALPSGALRVHYQPRVDLGSGAVVGYEALLRWQHPRRGLLGPAEFVELAEDSGLIRELGGWVLAQACWAAAGWHAADPDRRPLDIAVNLSAQQLADPNLTSVIADILADTGLDPTTLTLEVTETAVMSDADTALGVLLALKGLGIRLAIDDFGTGYSSLVYLKRFPVDELKIDRSFVDGLGREPEDTAIVTSIVSLARTLGLQVIAEGVETAGQRDVLLSLGCPLAQGFLFARPIPAEELDDESRALQRLASRHARESS
jgi:diguanylate cyclase (GGDEF)-like protein/PAS domain S-box-containing protein